MKVEKGDKGLLAFAPVVGVAALAVLAVPLLPVLFAANPDQVSRPRASASGGCWDRLPKSSFLLASLDTYNGLVFLPLPAGLNWHSRANARRTQL